MLYSIEILPQLVTDSPIDNNIACWCRKCVAALWATHLLIQFTGIQSDICIRFAPTRIYVVNQTRWTFMGNGMISFLSKSATMTLYITCLQDYMNTPGTGLLNKSYGHWLHFYNTTLYSILIGDNSNIVNLNLNNTDAICIFLIVTH